MPKPLASTFELDVPAPTRDDFVKVIGDCDFDYFTSHFQQIIDKRRRLALMKLNPFQRKVFAKLLPMVDPKTRLDRSKSVVFLKSRRVGSTTGLIAFINFILSYVEGIDNLNVLHLFPTGDTASKLYNSKVRDIVTGVVPDLMPTIYKESATSSVVLEYDNLLGVRRHNSYELASAGANSLRGSDFHIAIMDELASYRHPEDVEAVVSPMMPPHGFSLTIYASTFDDKMGLYFKEKIVTALANPDQYEVIFVPWYFSYPEESYGLELSDISLTEYDQQVIIPAMAEDGLSEGKWADAIEWYHRMSSTMSKSNMHKEFPTTIEEILSIGAHTKVFSGEVLQTQEAYTRPDRCYRLVTDIISGRPELQPDDDGDIIVYTPPAQGHKYMLCCDPIASVSEDSDFYVASVFDEGNNEQVAMLSVRGLPVEDLSDLTAGLAKIYNRATICPETNLAQALVACLRGSGYYAFYYPNKTAKAKSEPGFRTTVSTKPAMIDKLQLMLERKAIIVRSSETLRQLRLYEKQRRRSGSASFSAPKGDHDDQIVPLLLYAYSRKDRELMGKNQVSFAIL